ncbi:MAG: TonB family protein [Bacteroidetes bacterium]|nr:TonB family protein [Bacteroidota bacterium]
MRLLVVICFLLFHLNASACDCMPPANCETETKAIFAGEIQSIFEDGKLYSKEDAIKSQNTKGYMRHRSLEKIAYVKVLKTDKDGSNIKFIKVNIERGSTCETDIQYGYVLLYLQDVDFTMDTAHIRISACSSWNNPETLEKMELNYEKALKKKQECLGQKTEFNNEDNDDIYNICEVMAEFPGGEAALFKYLADNLIHPDTSSNIKGKIIVQVVIRRNGKVTDAKIIRGINPLFNEEALRLINAMPDWKPAMNKGKEVSMMVNLPVKFE